MLRIAFLTSLDPFNRQSGSGSLYYMLQSLQKYCGDVLCPGPMRVKEYLLGQIWHKSKWLILKKRFPYYMNFLLAQRYAQVATRRLRNNPCDIIVAPRGTVSTAFLETSIPLVLVEDATFALLHNYYPDYSNLSCKSIVEAHTITSQAFKRATMLVFSSAWAAQSAIKHYGISKEKIYVIPLGANIEQVPDKQTITEKPCSPHCRLLFVGRDWYRKGADIALETLLGLEKQGIEAELIICGCRPPLPITHERIKFVPYLNSNDPQQRKILTELYIQADFLLLPTRGDCTPCVFNEANAFGLPVVTADTGGVLDIIKDGINGFVLPYLAGGEAYARVIARAYQDEQLYKELRRTSREMFDAYLNWDSWGLSMQALFDSLCGSR
jgi:glycosyltransferase involved in cell wall biosynthesis